MSNARQLAANLPREGGLSNRNLIINSEFRVNQRNVTSTTGPSGSSKFLADRWITYCNGSDWSASIQEVTLPDGTVTNSLKTVTTTSAVNGFFHPFQRVEPYGKDYLQGKQVTLSAWVRTNVAGQFMRICDTVSCYLLGTAIPADGQWHKISAVHTMPTNMNTGASDTMQFQPMFNTVDLAVGDYCEFALAQMEVGDTATPFEHRSYSDELQRCMRYFCRFNGNTEHIGQNYSGTSMDINVALPVSMRATPTFTCTDTQNTAGKASVYSSGYNYGITAAISGGRSRSNQMMIRMTGVLSPSGAVNDAVQVQFNDMQFDAEL